MVKKNIKIDYITEDIKYINDTNIIETPTDDKKQHDNINDTVYTDIILF